MPILKYVNIIIQFQCMDSIEIFLKILGSGCLLPGGESRNPGRGLQLFFQLKEGVVIFWGTLGTWKLKIFSPGENPQALLP